MDKLEKKSISISELKYHYKLFLKKQNIAFYTLNTFYTDAFYIYKNVSKEAFWQALESDEQAKNILKETLSRNFEGNKLNKYINSYFFHLKNFKNFFYNNKIICSPPKPCEDEIERFLKKWKKLENYRLQEKSLDKLFHNLIPQNTDIIDILLKVSTLNDFYSTNIYNVFPVAKKINSIKNIDVRLRSGDISLVDEIKQIELKNKTINFYSFASKYCSHHNEKAFPIYDYYVDIMLVYFNDVYRFANFTKNDLKDYFKFKNIIISFQNYFKLEKYSLKQIDQYLWQIGKDYFPKSYKSTKKSNLT